MGFCQNIPTRFWVLTNSNFFGLKLFSKASRKFLLTLGTCSRYLKGSLKLTLCVSKKIVTARRTNQILCQEKWKKLRFWKNEAQNRVGIFWQTPIFWTETFFQRPLENFFSAWRTCSNYYLRGPPHLALRVSKKVVIIQQTNKKY